MPITMEEGIKGQLLSDVDNKDTLFTQLNYVYTYPSVLISILSGISIDKIGVIKAIKIYMSAILIGH